ncbi:hypothetical protein pb186bvf_000669 [Paramecium bursaria]
MVFGDQQQYFRVNFQFLSNMAQSMMIREASLTFQLVSIFFTFSIFVFSTFQFQLNNLKVLICTRVQQGENVSQGIQLRRYEIYEIYEIQEIEQMHRYLVFICRPTILAIYQ